MRAALVLVVILTLGGCADEKALNNSSKIYFRDKYGSCFIVLQPALRWYITSIDCAHMPKEVS